MFNPDSVIASMLSAQHADQQDRDDRKSRAMPELPKAGTIDAKAFVLAMRTAGQRTDREGKRYTDRNAVHHDKIRAIAGFVGYDHAGNFGAQEASAMAKAQATLNPKVDHGLTRDEQRAANRSLTGFVAGMPDAYQRKVADLAARETYLTDEMLAARKAGNTAEAQRLFALLGNVRDERDNLIKP